jgi:hypothetical protein
MIVLLSILTKKAQNLPIDRSAIDAGHWCDPTMSIMVKNHNYMTQSCEKTQRSKIARSNCEKKRNQEHLLFLSST